MIRLELQAEVDYRHDQMRRTVAGSRRRRRDHARRWFRPGTPTTDERRPGRRD
ncbi:hypothetical protein [Egicoccus sp. AB-alg6-2]|uniref:hypothetical protein n=1 Tax=Egicoccus sp. AB-alg6-2 TaxID=3242692 RepID=UPI00359D7E43